MYAFEVDHGLWQIVVYRISAKGLFTGTEFKIYYLKENLRRQARKCFMFPFITP